MPNQAIHITGLKEVTQAFKNVSKETAKELTHALIDAAEPVKQEATNLALTRIRNMPQSPRWAKMRIGVSQREATVYMVPSARRRRRTGRPNLTGLLLNRAMIPAVDQHQSDVIVSLVDMLENVGNRNGF